MDFLFNENSAYCILPESFIELHKEKMKNELGTLTEQDIENIKNIANKIEKIHGVGTTGTAYSDEDNKYNEENDNQDQEENFVINNAKNMNKNMN
jgi:S-adenosylmethionine:tRNA-ribosyltransferase-isomerase (queuine synthetase)